MSSPGPSPDRSLTVSTITARFAAEIVAAAEAAAAEIGVPVAISVCDRDGNLKAFLRMDGAALLSVGIAQDKAYTAASYGLPTGQWMAELRGDEALLTGIPHTPRFVVFGGGFPVVADGGVIAGLGVSGGSVDQDEQIGTVALRMVGLGSG